MFYNIKIPTHCKLVTYISLTTNQAEGFYLTSNHLRTNNPYWF